jgi:hypothetical protein
MKAMLLLASVVLGLMFTSYTAFPIMRPTNSNNCKWLSCIDEVGEGYNLSSPVALKRFRDWSNTRLIVSSRNSAKVIQNINC